MRLSPSVLHRPRPLSLPLSARSSQRRRLVGTTLRARADHTTCTPRHQLEAIHSPLRYAIPAPLRQSSSPVLRLDPPVRRWSRTVQLTTQLVLQALLLLPVRVPRLSSRPTLSRRVVLSQLARRPDISSIAVALRNQVSKSLRLRTRTATRSHTHRSQLAQPHHRRLVHYQRPLWALLTLRRPSVRLLTARSTPTAWACSTRSNAASRTRTRLWIHRPRTLSLAVSPLVTCTTP